MLTNFVVTYNKQDGYTGFCRLDSYEHNKHLFEDDLTLPFQFFIAKIDNPTDKEWKGLTEKAQNVWNEFKNLNRAYW